MSSIHRIRRSAFVQLRLADSRAVDVGALLGGEIRETRSVTVRSISPHLEKETALGNAELDLLASVSESRWTDVEEVLTAGFPWTTLERLAATGLVITDSDEPELVRHREIEEALRETGWPRTAACYHAASRWRAGSFGSDDESEETGQRPRFVVQDQRRDAAANARRFISEHGEPPPLEVDRGRVGESVPLPNPVPPGEDFFSVLAARRTCRTFERRSLGLEKLAIVLRWAFGCHGLISICEEYELQHKTSPSGGGLHPTEVYPLVFDVEGLEPGTYHYRPMDHSLSPLEAIDEEEGRKLAVEIAGGQDFVGEGSAVFLFTARFRRNFWKYRRSERTYSVILQDLGHLSQTFYLVAAQQGLGAAYTALVDSELVARRLGLEGSREGPLGLAVLGHRRAGSDRWLPITPYEPGDS